MNDVKRDASQVERPRDPVTLVRRDAPTPADRRVSPSFPSDLFEQARGRVRLLAGFFVCAFMFDLLVFLGSLGFFRFAHRPVSEEVARAAAFQWVNGAAILISAGLWWASRSPRISASRLHTITLLYEIAVCFVVATLTYWLSYLDTGLIPNLTWVPAIVIMFPLLMPGPPRRMTLAAIAAGAMAPLALLVLDLAGTVHVERGDGYGPAVIGSIFAIALAYLGSRVIYGLGREVAKARAMGSYQLEERLGEGGMGEVWRAKHRLLARTAAIKLIRPALIGNVSGGASEQARQRFEREAQAIARLRSPHTVDLFDFGIADDGSFYYAMELLEGLDADKLVRRFGPIPAERVVYLLQQVCHSLSEAESCGLVHRDVKPSNVFLCRYGEDYDFVKVLDFGIVKTSDVAPDSQTALTGGNVIHGTPAFMSPEQALGHTGVDGRADIYSVGCLGYWLLTGQLVFAADTPTEMLMKQIQSTPQPPSTRTEMVIPPLMDRVVLSCLAKDPAHRPQSAKELSRLLAEVDVGSIWTEERRREWWERHMPEAVAAAA
jgi:serine/threonine-protein kinase